MGCAGKAIFIRRVKSLQPLEYFCKMGDLTPAPVLILKGDWCAAAQPRSENQVCGELGDREDRFGKEGNTTSVVGFCLCQLTGVANG